MSPTGREINDTKSESTTSDVLKYEYDFPEKPLDSGIEEICTLPHADIYDKVYNIQSGFLF